jgi:hypothetical protein
MRHNQNSAGFFGMCLEIPNFVEDFQSEKTSSTLVGSAIEINGLQCLPATRWRFSHQLATTISPTPKRSVGRSLSIACRVFDCRHEQSAATVALERVCTDEHPAGAPTPSRAATRHFRNAPATVAATVVCLLDRAYMSCCDGVPNARADCPRDSEMRRPPRLAYHASPGAEEVGSAFWTE